MRVLLVSDSHGRNQNMEKVIRKVSPVDLLIHLGDLEGSEGYLEAIAPCPVEMVAGNNDFFSRLPREKVITIGRHQIFELWLWGIKGSSKIKRVRLCFLWPYSQACVG